ncbi:hypothetical protein [Streptomyces sp. NPDC102437]|uniref:zinc finger domain-containing protein n=1 Tax=Streptomyces sp. NPDC102437 TaxID=3366175 RepID=UPI00380AA2D5
MNAELDEIARAELDEIARAELIEREPCPRCGAPPGSVCRANSGVVAVDYHTGRYAKIPRPAGRRRQSGADVEELPVALLAARCWTVRPRKARVARARARPGAA